MIKVTNVEKVGNLIDFNLSNDDTILLSKKEFMNLNANELDENYKFDGIEYNYNGIFDKNMDIIGFKKI